MIICVKCRKEMSCHKNGVVAHFGHGHVYPGDLFRCSECGGEVLKATTSCHYEPSLLKLKADNRRLIEMNK